MLRSFVPTFTTTALGPAMVRSVMARCASDQAANAALRVRSSSERAAYNQRRG
eukprot:SAG11_NODE_36696_length_260_cov_0.937888_1_plen_52_part_10